MNNGEPCDVVHTYRQTQTRETAHLLGSWETSAYALGVNIVNVIDPAVVFGPDPLLDGDAAGARLVEVRRARVARRSESPSLTACACVGTAGAPGGDRVPGVGLGPRGGGAKPDRSAAGRGGDDDAGGGCVQAEAGELPLLPHSQDQMLPPTSLPQLLIAGVRVCRRGRRRDGAGKWCQEGGATGGSRCKRTGAHARACA